MDEVMSLYGPEHAEMSSVERRRQQNRLAQRKRRNTLKLQLQELEADNRELKAFKESIICAGRPDTTVRGIAGTGFYGDESHAPPPPPPLVLPDTCCSYLTSAEEDDFVVAAAAAEELNNAEVFAGELGGAVMELKMLQVQQQQQQQQRDDERLQMLLSASPTMYGGSGTPESVMEGMVGRVIQLGGDQSGDKEDDNHNNNNSSSSSSRSRSSSGSSNGADSLSSSSSVDSLFKREPSVPRHNHHHHHHHHHHHQQDQQQQHSGDGRHEAFRLAVVNGHVSMVQLLLRHGAAEINNAGGELGRAPLHDAAAANDAKMVDLLLDHGADVCAVDGAGMTALQIAASLGNVDAAESMLRRQG